MYREKVDENLKGEIKTHDTNKLRHAELVEKNVLPTSVDIAREKVPALIVNFDTEKLKHVEPVAKITLPSANDVVREQEELKKGANEKGGTIHS
ncbi:hypothetical protein WUBG_16263 [Wuchereria bancrofti]|nr:hypothetical protein WUBG_16263 [Wuchereria bancrofti]